MPNINGRPSQLLGSTFICSSCSSPDSHIYPFGSLCLDTQLAKKIYQSREKAKIFLDWKDGIGIVIEDEEENDDDDDGDGEDGEDDDGDDDDDYDMMMPVISLAFTGGNGASVFTAKHHKPIMYISHLQSV